MEKSDVDGTSRPWQNLFPELLSSISTRLNCGATYVTFACVCRQWRAAAKVAASDFVSSQPPMLVHFPPEYGDTLFFHGLVENKTYCKHIKGFRHLRCIGYSHGCLIMTDDRFRNVVILNPFTGARIVVDVGMEENVDVGTLSAPPASPNCHLFVASNRRALYHRLGSNSWIRSPLPSGISFLHALIVKNRVHALTDCGCIFTAVMDIISSSDPCASVPTYLSCRMNPLPPNRHGHLFPRIFEIRGELWAFSWQSEDEIEFYRFDSSSSSSSSSSPLSLLLSSSYQGQNCCWMKDELNCCWTKDELGDRTIFLCWNGCEAYDMTNCNRTKEIISRQKIYALHKVYSDKINYHLYVDMLPSPAGGQFDRLHHSYAPPHVAWLSPQDYI